MGLKCKKSRTKGRAGGQKRKKGRTYGCAGGGYLSSSILPPCFAAYRLTPHQGTAFRTASASAVAVAPALPLPRRLKPAPLPARAGSGAWPGEGVSRAPGTWARLPTWPSPSRSQPETSRVNPDSSRSSNDSMCGSDEVRCTPMVARPPLSGGLSRASAV